MDAPHTIIVLTDTTIGDIIHIIATGEVITITAMDIIITGITITIHLQEATTTTITVTMDIMDTTEMKGIYQTRTACTAIPLPYQQTQQLIQLMEVEQLTI